VDEHRVTGTVLKVTGGQSLVDAGEAGLLRCDLRARLFRRRRLRLAVGDRVEVLAAGDPAADDPEDGEAERRGVIEAVLPRRSALRRSRDFKRDQVVVANVDRVFVVVAVFDPPYKRAFVDRVLVGVERDGLEATIVWNKVDICDEEYRELVEEDAGVYADLGYPSLLTSAETGEGVAELAAAFRGRVSAVVGPSGVGKSTLLNRIHPGLDLPTGEVSEADGRGRHTTTAAELVRLPGGGWVVDTPGLRAFGLWDVAPGDLEAGFRDVAARAGACRFRDCAHVTEPDCAVRAAVAAGELDEERYQSYARLREELASDEARRVARRR